MPLIRRLRQPTPLPQQPVPRFPVLLQGLAHNLFWQRRRRRGLVPVQRIQIVPHKLLVKTVLRTSGPINLLVPKPGRIRRKNLVNQDNPAIVQPKLEFRIRNNNPPSSA